jgi:hypothetical protein
MAVAVDSAAVEALLSNFKLHQNQSHPHPQMAFFIILVS